jgi:hypothetical protein
VCGTRFGQQRIHVIVIASREAAARRVGGRNGIEYNRGVVGSDSYGRRLIGAACPFASLVPEVVRGGLATPDLATGPGDPV